jgi:hypothetical protein
LRQPITGKWRWRWREHWANRDDLGMGKQLGWVPPTPVYLIKMARAKRRAKRSGA